MDAKKVKENLKKAKKILLSGDDEIDAKIFEELKNTTADDKIDGALKCIRCGSLYPEAHAAEFMGKCSACAEREFSEKVTATLKKAFAVLMVFLIVITANYLLVRPLLGAKIQPLAEHKIFGNVFKNQFIYYAFEAFSVIYIVTSYFKNRGSKEDQRVVTATAVMLSVGLFMTSLLFKGNGLMIADFVLLAILLALVSAVVATYSVGYKKVRAFKFDTIELNAKIAQIKPDDAKSDNKAPVLETEAKNTEAVDLPKTKPYGALELSDGTTVGDLKKFVYDDYAEFSVCCDETLKSEYPSVYDVAAGDVV